MERTTTEDFLMKWKIWWIHWFFHGRYKEPEAFKRIGMAYSLDWTETSLFENFRVGVWWGKVCFLMDSKFGFTSSCWRKKPGWFVLLKSANCYCSKAFLCRHREVLRKEVDLLTGGGWNRTRLKLLTTGLQWVLPILHYLRWIFPLDCPWGMRLSYAYSELRLSLNICLSPTETTLTEIGSGSFTCHGQGLLHSTMSTDPLCRLLSYTKELSLSKPIALKEAVNGSRHRFSYHSPSLLADSRWLLTRSSSEHTIK